MKKHAIVTGAASGIGEALGRHLAATGLHVTLTDVDGTKLERVAHNLKRAALSAEARVLDVTNRDQVADVIAASTDRAGRLDYLFNNAGIGMAGEFDHMRVSDWRRIFEVNLFGVIHCIDAAYPLMRAQRYGQIVNIASIAGLVPLPGQSVYVASKHALVGLTETLRLEAKAHGVNVRLACPGVVDTPIYQTSDVVGFQRDKVLSLWPRGISADQCARRIWRGIQRNEHPIVITSLARGLREIYRLSPKLFYRAAEHYIERLRKVAQAPQEAR
ncbi:MAG: SDR family oxidoreductase [Deltaproteobacteria bacterium]|nr:SDR family oxidoreductase [Deltaproteobacteria bacterium]